MTLPEHLYHYTSKKGFLGILDIGSVEPKPKLWMTNILYLNDSSEFIHTIDLVKSELKKRRDNYVNDINELDDNTNRIYEEIENLCNGFPENAGTESYVFSLSKVGDDLNQWRGYCSEGGFCIEFDTNKLLPITRNEMKCAIEECIYERTHKEELIRKLLFDGIQTDSNSTEYMKSDYVSKMIYINIIHICSYIKDESFKDEQEYRILYHCSIHEKKEYRDGKAMIIPYIKVSPDDGQLPISKITVGPTPHPELSKLSVESLLKTNGYEKVEVEISKIPYRSW